MMSRTLLSIGLLSLSLLAFQLSMMQVLSLMQWHHFASFVIALALLVLAPPGRFWRWCAKGQSFTPMRSSPG